MAAPPSRVDAFLAQTEAVIAHDASAVLGEIDAPTLITFGARDLVCSTRFAKPLKSGIARERAGGLRASVARRAARGPRDLQPRDARLPAAPALVTATTAPGHCTHSVGGTRSVGDRPRQAHVGRAPQPLVPAPTPQNGPKSAPFRSRAAPGDILVSAVSIAHVQGWFRFVRRGVNNTCSSLYKAAPGVPGPLQPSGSCVFQGLEKSVSSRV